jgi:peptidoglycan/LPS O-acetylase OafA/YrhL
MRRFYTLDALRGIAALTVFAGHAGPLMTPIALGHSMLAVDLFFMLSGYVIDRAYADRLTNGLTPLQFMRARWIRLYPLYILGGLIGIAGAGISLAAGQGIYTPGAFATAALFTVLMFPSPTWQANIWLMPMNFPAWSLFFEMLANALFAVFVRFLTVRRLLVTCGLSALWLAQVAISHDGLHDGFDWVSPWVGIPRVLFGFFAGVAIRRLTTERQIVTRWAYFVPLAVLPLFTSFGGGLGDAIKTIILFPILIIVAASVEPPRVRSFMALGVISYPLYTLHVPVIQIFERALTVLHVDRTILAPWAGLALGGGIAVASLLLDRFYDQPVRKWLTTVVRTKKLWNHTAPI